MLYEVLLVVYLIVALMLIGFVLIQQGKGADMGASFGAGGSNTVFGAPGAGNFMTKTTAILATLFFLVSLTLGNITANRESAVDEWENLEVPAGDAAPTDVPAVPEQAAPANEDVPVAQEEKSEDTPD
ncbi:preprotein translocase subunit SecG [Alteromonas sp. CYL-A6]|uniref:preprotein translocase subunit SecG n=1 Tax=Alteromonas nitratireducens TaxID=3390813 RepID=UPI0034BB3B26